MRGFRCEVPCAPDSLNIDLQYELCATCLKKDRPIKTCLTSLGNLWGGIFGKECGTRPYSVPPNPYWPLLLKPSPEGSTHEGIPNAVRSPRKLKPLGKSPQQQPRS